jgi:hypothetical protein
MKHKNNIRVIGRREYINFPELGITRIEGKIDTGAYTSSLHCENIEVNYENSKPILYFTVQENEGIIKHRYEEFETKKIKNSFGEMEERFVINTIFEFGKRKIRSIISLSNRDNMKFPVLLGRRVLKGKFLIDVKLLHTDGIEIQEASN